jgi:pyruvate formate lyase activating enzyme
LNATDKTSIFGYLKNPSMVDFPGRMAATFLVSGCNFGCGFCHNANLMGKFKPGLERRQLDEACNRFKADWVTACVVSGGEPTVAPDLPEILAILKGHGFIIKLDTNGSRPDQLEHVLPLVDYVAMDIKCGLNSYSDLTGFNDIDAIAKSIALVRQSAKDYEFRTTLIHGFHGLSEIEAVGEAAFGAKRLAVQPFIPREELPSPRFLDTPRTTPAELHEAAKVLENYVTEVIVRGAGKEHPKSTQS